MFHNFSNYLKYKVKALLAKNQVVGYPKCGNTWLRMLVCNALSIEYNVTLDVLLNDYHINVSPIPNIIWSHGSKHRKAPVGPGNMDPNISFGNKTLFLVRDPRDVLISFYYHEVYRRGMASYPPDEWKGMFSTESNQVDVSSKEPLLSAYIRSELRGIDYVIHFYNYFYDNREKYRAFEIVRYEDLHQDTAGELEKVLAFLGIAAGEETIRKAVEASTFDKMRRIELNNPMPLADLGTPSDPKDKRTFKTRKGKVGAYREELSEEDIAYLDERICETLNPVFGYDA